MVKKRGRLSQCDCCFPTQGAVQGWCAPSYSPTVPSAIAVTLTAPPRCAGLWRAITWPPPHRHQVTAPSAPRERKRSTPGWTCLSLVGLVWCVLCGVLCGVCYVVCVVCCVVCVMCCVVWCVLSVACCLVCVAWCVLRGVCWSRGQTSGRDCKGIQPLKIHY